MEPKISFVAILLFVLIGCRTTGTAQLNESGSGRDTRRAESSASDSSLCEDAVLAKHLDQIDRILNVESPWKTTFDFRDAKFLIHMRDRKGALARGFSADHLRESGFDATPCIGRPAYSLVSNTTIPDPANGLFELIDGTEQFLFDHYAGLGYGDYAKLSKLAQKPIATMLLPIQIDISVDPASNPAVADFLANRENEAALILVHELFHAHEKWGDPPVFGPREVAFNCASNPEWKSAILAEINDWRREGPSILRMSAASARALARAILEHRQSSPRECWQQFGYWERIEGTAMYVESMAGFDSGVLSIKRDPIKLGEMFGAASDPASEDWEPFYATGNLLCRLMRVIDPSLAWQARIETGVTPETALGEILARQ